MNRVIFILVFFFLISLVVRPLSAQPAWVKSAQQNASLVNAHRGAAAILLHNTATVMVSKDGKVKRDIQLVYKILSEEGQEFGIYSVPVYPFRKLKKLQGWHIGTDGRSEKLKKEHIAQLSLDESAGYRGDGYLMMAALPGIETGSVVAFHIILEEVGTTALYQSFTFQKQQPVSFARYTVELPAGWEMNSTGWRLEDAAVFQHNENIYTWTARDLPFQAQEPLAPSWYYLSRRISITCFDPQINRGAHFPDWRNVAEWCADIHQQPALVTENIAAESRRLTADLTVPAEKLQAIADFSRSEIRYVAIEIGKGRWVPRPAEATLFNRYGDCKDKTTLMRSMLKAVNIEAVPALASVNYPVNDQLPTPFQFDHCIVAVPLGNQTLPQEFSNAVVDNWLFFDPTDEVTPLGELPRSLQGRLVMLGTARDTVLVRLPYPDPEDHCRKYVASAQLHPDGTFTATFKIVDAGTWATQLRYYRRVHTPVEELADWQDDLADIVAGIRLHDIHIGDSGDSSWVIFSASGSNLLQKVGNLTIMQPDLFHDSGSSPLTAEERQYPIWFGAPKEISWDICWELPPGYTAEVDTTMFEGLCPGGSFNSQWRVSENQLELHGVERYTGELMWPEEYGTAKAFSRDLNAIKGQTVFINIPGGRTE